MAFSNKTLIQLANALVPEIVESISTSEYFVDFMLDVIPDVLQEKMGNIDEDLKMDLSVIIMERIALQSIK
jgi:hypothetical protein